MKFEKVIQEDLQEVMIDLTALLRMYQNNILILIISGVWLILIKLH